MWLILISLLAFANPKIDEKLLDIEKACLKKNTAKECICLKSHIKIFLENEKSTDKKYLIVNWLEAYYDNQLNAEQVAEDPLYLGGSAGVLVSFGKACKPNE